ncbi:MAG: transcriptional regulator GlxA family with amidase domain [Candidatus Azotimanducaceae bacterium]|jgi:transcriptional regulator GlxA family with amidase domain
MESIEQMAAEHKPLLNWMVARWKKGASIACNCTAAFLLAKTGLLDGRKATTSWWLERQFRQCFPWVQLDLQVRVTEDERLFCSAAMTAHYFLALWLIEQQSGPALADLCSKTMLIDYRDRTQPAYQNLLIDSKSEDPLVAKTQYWLKNHLREDFNLSGLADIMQVSQRTLIRRFKTELDVPPIKYLQNLRIETAKQLLENTNIMLSDVTVQVGYSDVSSFSRLFKRRIGLSPSAYRQRFQLR